MGKKLQMGGCFSEILWGIAVMLSRSVWLIFQKLGDANAGVGRQLQGDGSQSEWEWLADCLPSPRWMAQHVEALVIQKENVVRSCCLTVIRF